MKISFDKILYIVKNTFKSMDNFKKFFSKSDKTKKDIQTKQEDGLETVYSEPLTIFEIANKCGGLNNLNYGQLLDFLHREYYNKNVKIVFISEKENDKNIENRIKRLSNENDSHEIKVSNIRLILEIINNNRSISVRFHIDVHKYIQIGGDSQIMKITKRKITKEDPFGEEEWE